MPLTPSTRSQTLKPSKLTSTRSTSSATIRACLAGKSSSHTGAGKAEALEYGFPASDLEQKSQRKLDFRPVPSAITSKC